MNARALALPAPSRRLLAPDEAAAYCGGKTVQWLRAHVKVAPMKIGSKILYDVRALDRWIDGKSDGLGRPETGDEWLSRLDEGEGDGA